MPNGEIETRLGKMLAMDRCAKENRLIARQSLQHQLQHSANTCSQEKANAAQKKLDEKGSESKRRAMHKMHDP